MLVATALGCSDGDEFVGDEPLQFETEHFRYHADAGRPLCAQTGHWLERTYGAFTNYLEVPPERAQKIDYYFTDARAAGRACNAELAGGCAVGSERIFSETELSRHEIVHIVAAQKYGFSIPLFAEGLAGMLTCGVSVAIQPTLDKHLVPVETLLTLDGISGDLDPEKSQIPRVVGRSLVRYLIERFGKQGFLSLYAALPEGTSLGGIRERFADLFGISLASVLRDWEAMVERQDESCVYPLECEDPPVSGRVDFVSACGLGADVGTGIRFFPFEVSDSSRVRIDVFGDAPSFDPELQRWRDGTSVRIAACRSGNFGLQTRYAPFTQLFNAPSGRYFVQTAATPGIAAALQVTNMDAPSEACAAEDPVPIGIGHDVVVSRRGVASVCEGQPWCPGDRVELVAEEAGQLLPTFDGDESFGLDPGQFLFRCDEACPGESSTCLRDHFVGGGVPGTTFNVVGSSVEAGEILHLAAGPNADAATNYVRYILAPR